LDDEDRALYLQLLRERVVRHGVLVDAYIRLGNRPICS
jgi:hypothetical protein